MITRLALRLSAATLAIAVIGMMALTGIVLAYSYTVVFGTSGNDVINEAGKPGNFHIYGFQGSDTITGGSGTIDVVRRFPVIRGYDLIYGDGECTQTPPGNDSYCVHPFPWLPQPWTDAPTATDTLTGGVGPDWIVGGGGSNVIKGSQTYDVITAGPHQNTITGGALGSAIIAIQPSDVSDITLKRTFGVIGYDGLPGIPNDVDVYGSKGPNTITCASPRNYDVIFANRTDTVRNCWRVIFEPPRFPGVFLAHSPSSLPFTFPPGMSGSPTAGDTHVVVTRGRTRGTHRSSRLLRLRVVRTAR